MLLQMFKNIITSTKLLIFMIIKLINSNIIYWVQYDSHKHNSLIFYYLVVFCLKIQIILNGLFKCLIILFEIIWLFLIWLPFKIFSFIIFYSFLFFNLNHSFADDFMLIKVFIKIVFRIYIKYIYVIIIKLFIEFMLNVINEFIRLWKIRKIDPFFTFPISLLTYFPSHIVQILNLYLRKFKKLFGYYGHWKLDENGRFWKIYYKKLFF